MRGMIPRSGARQGRRSHAVRLPAALPIVCPVKRFASSRWLQLGSALASVGVGLAVFALEQKPGATFWDVWGFVSIALLVLGAAALGKGFFQDADADTRTMQNVHAASPSQVTQVANVSARGDVTVSPEQHNG
jgi:hypothetical protein